MEGHLPSALPLLGQPLCTLSKLLQHTVQSRPCLWQRERCPHGTGGGGEVDKPALEAELQMKVGRLGSRP